LDAGLKLPALKLMTESEDEHLRKLTQDQIKNITDVSLILNCVLSRSPYNVVDGPLTTIWTFLENSIE